MGTPSVPGNNLSDRLKTTIYQYNFPTIIRFGAGASLELADYVKDHRWKRPLLVTDPTVSQLEFFDAIVKSLKSKGLEPAVFSSIHKNPVKSDIYSGSEAFGQSNADCIVGIGGGAALDVARAIALRINHREDLFVYDDLVGGSKFVTNEVPPFITIPTTAGTGSEVGRSAIIADDETHQKRILFSPKLLAQIVFADPMLTMDLPAPVTAATGMDALTHNMEAYLAKMSHPICEGIALEGIGLVSHSLEEAVNRPSPGSRSRMLMASLMGAIAFQKGLGVVHSLAHPLSQLLDIHHGLANAVMIPYGLQFNIGAAEEKFRRIARALDLEDETGVGVVTYIKKLRSSIGIPDKLGDLGVEIKHVPRLSELALADFCHPDNPRPVALEDFRALYEQAL